MGFRFSRRVSILPGLKLNLSGSGVSLSAGVRGAHIDLGPRGLYGSAGIPEPACPTGSDWTVPPGATIARRWNAAFPPASGRPCNGARSRKRRRGGPTSRLMTNGSSTSRCSISGSRFPEIPRLDNFIQAQTRRHFESAQPLPPELVWPEEEAICLNELGHYEKKSRRS